MSKENICIRCNKSVGNAVFTVCDDCWEIDDNVKRKVQAYYDRVLKEIIAEGNNFSNMRDVALFRKILKEKLTK